ncbi:ABC transporter substrate-binding protein [Sphingomonas crusticola]|uniref:ABC transporter substrate-binding protein n=1 Tax=Sphingomonas crusticola TaxID=1697973 RepID=UPI000E248CC3|nr:substrate-binding domain-containing protein [Sphingomonas crusticola]
MTRRTLTRTLCGLTVLAVCLLLILDRAHHAGAQGSYLPPEGVTVSFFPARDGQVHQPLVIGAATDVSFMRAFIEAFQAHHQTVPVAYIDSLSTALLARADQACRTRARTADLYLSSSSDHLVLLANRGCALKLRGGIAALAPGGAQWRDEVAAFTVEPAVFVYGRSIGPRQVPRSHVMLIEWLRNRSDLGARIGTYDIESSGTGYNFVAEDAQQSAIYGRLIESLGRTRVRLYCCSNAMVDAVDRGEILFAYNVQMSYAYAAQRSGSRIGVILPTDYQAIQTRSIMIPTGARDIRGAEEFARFLTSGEGRALARRQLMAPDLPAGRAGALADALLDQAVVSPLLLTLQDRARRERMIREWRQALRPADAPRDPAADLAEAKKNGVAAR